MIEITIFGIIFIAIGILFLYTSNQSWRHLWVTAITSVMGAFTITLGVLMILSPWVLKTNYSIFIEDFNTNQSRIETIEDTDYAKNIAEKYNQELAKWQTDVLTNELIEDCIGDEVLSIDPIKVKETN